MSEAVAIVVAPLAWLARPSHLPPGSTVWAVLGLAVVCTGIAFIVFFALIGEIGPARATLITFVNPAVAVVLGALVLDEKITAATIGDAYRRFIPEPITEMLVSGGGAKNPVLLSMLTEACAPLAVVPFDARYFDGEAKEAVAFALLAHLHLEGIPGNVPTATGARGRRVLGMLTPA